MTLTKCVGQIKPFLAVVGNNVTSKTYKQTNKKKKKKKRREISGSGILLKQELEQDIY